MVLATTKYSRGPLCRDKERARGEVVGEVRGRVNTKSNKQGVVANGREMRMQGFPKLLL